MTQAKPRLGENSRLRETPWLRMQGLRLDSRCTSWYMSPALAVALSDHANIAPFLLLQSTRSLASTPTGGRTRITHLLTSQPVSGPLSKMQIPADWSSWLPADSLTPQWIQPFTFSWRTQQNPAPILPSLSASSPPSTLPLKFYPPNMPASVAIQKSRSSPIKLNLNSYFSCASQHFI